MSNTPNSTGENIYSCKTSFKYSGKDALITCFLKLLVSMRASGVKIKELDSLDDNGIFTVGGQISFKVEGTESEVKEFSRVISLK